MKMKVSQMRYASRDYGRWFEPYLTTLIQWSALALAASRICRAGNGSTGVGKVDLSRRATHHLG